MCISVEVFSLRSDVSFVYPSFSPSTPSEEVSSENDPRGTNELSCDLFFSFCFCFTLFLLPFFSVPPPCPPVCRWSLTRPASFLSSISESVLEFEVEFYCKRGPLPFLESERRGYLSAAGLRRSVDLSEPFTLPDGWSLYKSI